MQRLITPRRHRLAAGLLAATLVWLGAGVPLRAQERSSVTDERLARFLGLANILAGEIRSGWAETGLGPVPVPSGSPDGPARLVIRPRAFRADPEGPLEAVVASRVFRGGGYLAGLHIGSITVETYLRRCPAVGSGLRLSIGPDEVSILD